MFKSFLLPLSLLAIAGTASAQATLTAANFNPILGDAFSVVICDTTGVNPGASGASALWNFASLNDLSVDTGRVIVKTSGNGNWNYPSANSAIKGPTFFSPGTNYLLTNSTTLAQYGYYSATDTNLILSNPAEQLRYPFTYLTTFSDTYAGILRLGAISAHHNGTINVLCDGWGMLILPSSVHSSTLRVHTTQTFTDSTSLFGSPVVKSYNISSYDWYKPDYHTALLTIQTVTEVGSLTPTTRFVVYADQQFNAVPGVDKKIADLQLAPNPASDILNIKLMAATNDPVRIAMYDMLGREVAVIAEKQSKGQQQISFNTKNYARGTYFVVVQSGTESVTKKVELQ